MSAKILPRNLTARAAHQVLGNPVATRFESGVANCFPGLEFDVRVLDTRFFPGILFQFVTTPLRPLPDAIPNQQGCRVLYLDYLEDPMLPEASREPWIQNLRAAFSGNVGAMLSDGRWYVDWIEQSGKRLVMSDGDMNPYDGELVWRLVRGLEPEKWLKLGLTRRDPAGSTPHPTVQLEGYRRHYVDAAGVFDDSYRPGELSESMCNPWSHDFRDCGCHYWASNHPDVVFGVVPKGDALPDGESKNAPRAATYLDWIRKDQGLSGAVASESTIDAARPLQIDHYEVNQHWEKLRFVLDNHEILTDYARPKPPSPKPYASATELIDKLEQELAPMELALALEYLYALFSLKDADEAPKDRWPTLKDDLAMARQFLTIVAVGEMTHLRWANQILWELDRAGVYPPGRHYAPVLVPSKVVPVGGVMKPRSLRPLTPDALRDFIAAERPATTLDTEYARVVATLEQGEYPRHLYELAVRIDTDGNQHFERFRDVRHVLRSYQAADPPYLRPVKVGTPEQAQRALELFSAVLGHLGRAYASEAKQDFTAAQSAIDAARTDMDRLRAEAESLARRGIGIPFWES